MSMTQDQVQRMRVLMQEAFDLVLSRPITFVMAISDPEGNSFDILSSTPDRQSASELLKRACVIVQEPPDEQLEVKDHRATGESAGVKSAQEATPGMECGHAEPQAPAITGNAQPNASSREGQPAAPAVSERCWRRTPPSFEEQCPNNAAGGIRLKLFPALAIQKRYGKRDMLALILDLPVCAECFTKMTALEVINNQDPKQWTAFSKVAQQRNHGILPIKELSEIEHLSFDDPEYVLLRKQIAAKAAANESQPAPAGPQQGAGDGQS